MPKSATPKKAGNKPTTPRKTALKTPSAGHSAPEPDLAQAREMVMQLMAIPGKSGEEALVADYIRTRLTVAGLSESALKMDTAHRRTPIAGQVGNLILKLPGTLRAPRRILMAHMDTVPICVGSRPVRKGGMIRSADPKTGLGADDRAGVAVVLNTALEILTHKLPHPPLTFLWLIQEEVGLHGARQIRPAALGNPKLAFNWDGGAPDKLTMGATGGYRMRIEVEGIASHAGGAPEMGVSAIAIASLAIADLARGGWHGDIHQDGCHGTSNVGFIHGGEATNVVTDRVILKAEARSHDPKFRKRIIAQIERSFKNAARELTNAVAKRGKVTFDGSLDYESFRLADDEPCIAAAEAAVTAVGRQPVRSICNGGLDANWMYQHGIPAVTIGCGQLNQHMTSEALDIAGFEDACRIALRLATATEA